MYKFIFISLFETTSNYFLYDICDSVLFLYFALFFFFFFKLSPRPWFLQILAASPGPSTLVVVFLHRY